MSEKKGIIAGPGCAVSLNAMLTADIGTYITATHSSVVAMVTPYRLDWTKDQWLDFLESYNDCEGLQEALKLMNSKLYKELK